MNEYNLLSKIQNIIKSEFIGDDCAYLKDQSIVVTQDSLIEDIHFKRTWCTPYQLGYKSIIVNISDILAAGAIPKYVTISLSLPSSINEDYVYEFYNGVKTALGNAIVIGGDLTGSTDKIAISVTAIGCTDGRNISSRKNAKNGYIVLTKGLHGSSSAGLSELINNSTDEELIKEHLEPQLEYKFSELVATTVKEQYAMMDTSDGLADALYKIAEASNVRINIDYNKVPHLNKVSMNNVLFGGEDYKLVAVVPEEYSNIINDAVKIGEVEEYDGVRLNISGTTYNDYSQLPTYNHFS